MEHSVPSPPDGPIPRRDLFVVTARKLPVVDVALTTCPAESLAEIMPQQSQRSKSTPNPKTGKIYFLFFDDSQFRVSASFPRVSLPEPVFEKPRSSLGSFDLQAYVEQLFTELA